VALGTDYQVGNVRAESGDALDFVAWHNPGSEVYLLYTQPTRPNNQGIRFHTSAGTGNSRIVRSRLDVNWTLLSD
jgi:hypothetical protein